MQMLSYNSISVPLPDNKGTVDSGELLEPFRPRNSAVDDDESATMYRRGSVIVISSLDDADKGLLEGFGPRGKDEDDENDQEKEQEEMHTSRSSRSLCRSRSQSPAPAARTSPVVTPLASPKEEAKTKTRTTLDYLWQSMPSVPQWSSPSQHQELKKSQSSRLELKSQELKTANWKKVMQTVQDTDDFRQLQQEMRQSTVMTGAHEALVQLVQNKAKERASLREGGRRRSNSFNDLPTKSQVLESMKSEDMTASLSDLNVNLSPFAEETYD